MNESAQQVSRALLNIQSVLMNVKEPFTYTSGKQGPVYVDVRRLASFPVERNLIIQKAVERLTPILSEIDVIAGGETAGIPYAAFIAAATDKPMIYVRKKAKGFGRMAQIEGELKEGARVLLVEDLSNFGGSTLGFVDVLRQAGAQIENSFVVFDYGRLETEQNMQENNVTLHALATWKDVIETARSDQLLDDQALHSVESYLDNPDQWKAA